MIGFLAYVVAYSPWADRFLGETAAAKPAGVAASESSRNRGPQLFLVSRPAGAELFAGAERKPIGKAPQALAHGKADQDIEITARFADDTEVTQTVTPSENAVAAIFLQSEAKAPAPKPVAAEPEESPAKEEESEETEEAVAAAEESERAAEAEAAEEKASAKKAKEAREAKEAKKAAKEAKPVAEKPKKVAKKKRRTRRPKKKKTESTKKKKTDSGREGTIDPFQ